MPCREDDDKPFNPFYIGPHPSQACDEAPPDLKWCSPSAKNENKQTQATNAAGETTVATIGVVAAHAAGAGAGATSGQVSSAASGSASVVGATDDASCQNGKDASGGNAANVGSAENTGGTGTAAAAPASPARRSVDSINRDDQKNGHAGAANTNVAGGLLIVGIAGPTGGMATVYSTGQLPSGSLAPPVCSANAPPHVASTKQMDEQTQVEEQKPCPTYPCMERNRDRPN